MGGLTTKKYASMTHASRATAFRELDQLLELGVLVRIRQGRAVRYEMVLGNAAKMLARKYGE